MKLLMKLEAGRYYIGDPCYTFSGKDHDSWIDFLDRCDWGRNENRISEYEGHKFFTAGTAWGDGTYLLHGPDVHKYLGVDAGMLAVMPEALAKGVSEAHEGLWGKDGDGLYAFVDFDHDFEVSCDDGTFHFGKFVIDTKRDVEEEEAWSVDGEGDNLD